MIWQKAEIFNAAELIDQADGGVSWLRVPAAVRDAMETDQGKRMAECATGVELRFVLKGEQAVIRMRTMTGDGIFHVYRGGIQGGWEDHEVHKMVGTQAEEFVIRRSVAFLGFHDCACAECGRKESGHGGQLLDGAGDRQFCGV